MEAAGRAGAAGHGASWRSVPAPDAPGGIWQVLRSGQDKLADMNYLHRSPRLGDNDRLRYEKRMVEEWFNKTILQKKS